MPEERTCSICGVTREDVADVAYYGDNHERRLKPLCSDCKARHLVRKRRSRRQRISRGNRAIEIGGMVLLGAGVFVLLIIVVAAIATRV